MNYTQRRHCLSCGQASHLQILQPSGFALVCPQGQITMGYDYLGLHMLVKWMFPTGGFSLGLFDRKISKSNILSVLFARQARYYAKIPRAGLHNAVVPFDVIVISTITSGIALQPRLCCLPGRAASGAERSTFNVKAKQHAQDWAARSSRVAIKTY